MGQIKCTHYVSDWCSWWNLAVHTFYSFLANIFQPTSRKNVLKKSGFLLVLVPEFIWQHNYICHVTFHLLFSDTPESALYSTHKNDHVVVHFYKLKLKTISVHDKIDKHANDTTLLVPQHRHITCEVQKTRVVFQMWNNCPCIRCFTCEISHVTFYRRFTCEISHVKFHMLKSRVKFCMWYFICEKSHVIFHMWTVLYDLIG